MKLFRTTLIISFLVLINVHAQDSLYSKVKLMMQNISSDSLTLHIKNLETPGGNNSRIVFTKGNDSAAQYIARVFTSLLKKGSVKLDTLYIPTSNPTLSAKPLFNIEAILPGKIYPDSVLIFCAHYDCSASHDNGWISGWDTMKAPGADDNATGLAALFELARVMSDSAYNFQNDYTIKLIAFEAEESNPIYSGHHYGSLHYVNDAYARNEKIIGAISIDMIGFNIAHNFNAIATNSKSVWLYNKAFDLNSSFHIGLTLIKDIDNGDYSDHTSFWAEGYPAILFIENTWPWNSSSVYQINPYYHSSMDDISTVNFTLVKKITQLNLGLAAYLSNGIPLGVHNSNNNIVSDFNLEQNFPNPFNSSTIISFNLPVKSFVNLSVFNILGQKVLTVENKFLDAGYHTYIVSLNEFSSGTYIYQIKTDSYTSTKKMILLK